MNKRDTTGPIDQDVEGHRSYSSSDRTIKDQVEPVAWESDEDTKGHGFRGNVSAEGDEDVEGHRSYSSSDRTIKDHVEPVSWESEQDTEGHGVRVRFGDADTAEGDDVEGHRFSSSDRTIKDHVEPVSWESAEGEDDTDGHMTRGRG
jgi:hypothetical protein